MKTLVQTFFLVLMSLTAHGQDINGDWDGTLQTPGAQFRIVFHVSKTAEAYITTMDSPDQNVSGIPVTVTNFRYPDVKLEITNLGVIYEGSLADEHLRGRWMQSGQSFPLVLSRTMGYRKKH
jgi:hypothetical protein